MASEWVKTYCEARQARKRAKRLRESCKCKFHFPQGKGAEILVLSGSGEEGKIQIEESPDKVIALLR